MGNEIKLGGAKFGGALLAGDKFSAALPVFATVAEAGGHAAFKPADAKHGAAMAASAIAASDVVVDAVPGPLAAGELRFEAGGAASAEIATMVLARGDRITTARDAGFPFERVRLLNPELAASVASIREREGLPRGAVAAVVAPSSDLSDTMIFESPANAAEQWYLPRYRVAIDTLADGTQRYRVRLAPRAPGWALTIALEPYPAVEVAGASATAQVLAHELAVVLRYAVAGSGIEKELAFGDRAAVPGGVSVTVQLPTLPEATEVFFALTEPVANTQLIVRRLIQVAIPVEPAPPKTGEVNWHQVFVRPVKVLPEMIVPVDPVDPFKPDPVDVGGLSRVAMQGGMRVPRAAAAGFSGLGLSGATGERRLEVLRGSRLRDVLAVDPDVVDVHVAPPEQRFRVVSRTLDDRPGPAPFFFPLGAHGYIFEGFAAVGAAPSSSVPHQLTWKGRSHTYYQDASRPQVFYYLPDSFKLARSPDSPHRPILSVEFRSPDGEMDGMRAQVRFAAAPAVDPDRLAAAAAGLLAVVPAEAGEPSLQPLLADRSRLRFTLMLPGAAAATDMDNAVLDVRLGLTAALDLSFADFQVVFDALFAGGGSLIFSGGVEVAVGGEGRPAEEVPFRGRLDDLVGDLFDYERSAEPGGGLRIEMRNAIESPLQVDSLHAELMRDGAATDAPITGLALPVAKLEPGHSLSFIVGAATSPSAGVDDVLMFDVAGVRVLPDREAIWTAVANSRTVAFLRRVTVLAANALFEASAGADPLIEIDVEVGMAGGGLTTTVVLTAEQLAFEVSVPFPLADVVLGREDVGAFRYRVSGIRSSGQTTRDWRTVTSPRLWILAPDVT